MARLAVVLLSNFRPSNFHVGLEIPWMRIAIFEKGMLFKVANYTIKRCISVHCAGIESCTSLQSLREEVTILTNDALPSPDCTGSRPF